MARKPITREVLLGAILDVVMGAYGWHHLRGLSLLGSSRLTPGRTENEWPNSQ
jgi:hypothetical protein